MTRHRTFRTGMRLVLLSLCLSSYGCRHKTVKTHWYRGNLHVHSLWSDGAMLPEQVVRWYRDHGYQFVGLAEHNLLPTQERWISAGDVHLRGNGESDAPDARAFEVDTRVREGVEQWRLKPLSELKPEFERSGKFLLLCNEEVTNWVQDHPVHVTAVNVNEPIDAVSETTPALAIEQTLARISKQSRAQRYPALGIVNHPNFAWAVSVGDLARVSAARFVEIFNGHPYTASRGDMGRRSVVRMWDMANAERLLERGWPPLFGVASDDAHVATGAKEASPGRGWVFVRASALNTANLVDALRRGDFYASTGVRLKRLDYDATRQVLSLAIEPEPGTTYVTEYIATKSAAHASDAENPNDRWDAPNVGVVVASHASFESRYTLASDDVFVRATVTASRPPDNPMDSNYTGDATQLKQAFTQPVGWVHYLAQRHAAIALTP